MKVLVAGAGSIGTVLGLMLAKHEQVALLRRTKYTSANIRHRITGLVNDFIEVEIGNLNYFNGRQFDVVLITTQGQDTDIICQQLSQLVTEDTTVVSLQNGVTNGDIIYHYFPSNEIILGTVWWSATLLSSNHVYYHNAAPMRLGYYPKSAKKQRLKQINTMLQQDFDCDISENIIKELHTKLVLNVVAPVLALVKEPYPQGLRITEVRMLTHCLFDEALKIVESHIGKLSDERLDKFHNLLLSEPQLQITSAQHKVSTQISAEKHGGKGSNVNILLGTLEQLSGTLPHPFISAVKEMICTLPVNYKKVPLTELQHILQSYKKPICTISPPYKK